MRPCVPNETVPTDRFLQPITTRPKNPPYLPLLEAPALTSPSRFLSPCWTLLYPSDHTRKEGEVLLLPPFCLSSSRLFGNKMQPIPTSACVGSTKSTPVGLTSLVPVKLANAKCKWRKHWCSLEPFCAL